MVFLYRSFFFVTRFFQTVFLKHIMGRSLVDNEYHVNIIRFQLTRNIAQLYDGLRDEIEVAFKDNIPLTDGAYVQVTTRQ